MSGASLLDEGLTFPHERSEHVRRAIASAFGGFPPSEAALLAPQYAQAPKAPDILRLFGGKKWSELDQPTLNECGILLFTFSPEGFRYYLPALLTHSLAPEIAYSFIETVLLLLKPDWTALYVLGQDSVPDEIGGLLDETQQRAVAEYLHLVIDAEGVVVWTVPDTAGSDGARALETMIKWHAAEALRWRWNRVDTPGLRAARAAFDEIDHGGRLRPAEADARLVADHIECAFADTPAPPKMLDYWETDEPPRYAVQFRGRDWKALSPLFLSHHSGVLWWFSREAFRYFLPAYLIADLTGIEWIVDPVSYLTRGLDWRIPSGSTAGEQASSQRRFAILAPKERAAIVAYLEYKTKATKSRLQAEDIRHALMNYWRPSLT